RRAKMIYIIDVFKFFRSYTLRRPKFINLLIHWIMIGSYIKTSGRAIVRNKLFSSINIIGLSISMSVGLLMIAFLADLLSYDKFHDKASRIYRVNSSHHSLNNPPMFLASNSVKAGKKISETVAGIEETVILRRQFGGDANYNDNIVPVSGLWATDNFFKLFSFPLLTGDAKTALKEPYSIVLTESAATKVFGKEEALGKSIKFDTTLYVVTGVMEDVPKFSHIRFEALVSFATAEIQQKNNTQFLNFGSVWNNYIYVLLPPEGTKPESIQGNIDKLAAAESKGLEHTTIKLWLQPLSEIALGEDLSNPIGPTMNADIVWVIGGLAFVVILCAGFNYTNLSIARSMRRSREVGIRKVIGALKGHVMMQLIAEAVIISLMALVIAFGLYLIIRPQFLSFAPEVSTMVSLDLSVRTILFFIALAIVVGLAAGLLPAFFFSKVNAVSVLKDASSLKVFKRLNMRKALIVVQYVFSLIFISATLIGYRQYKSFLTFDLGYQTENILNISLQGNKPDALIKELSEIPEVSMISKSQMVTSVGNYWGSSMKYNDPKDSASVWYNKVDENYLPLHGHRIIAGRNLKAKVNNEETEVLVNEQTLKRFDIGQRKPEKALGEFITVDGRKLEIVGVLRDFHYGKVDSQIEPVIFRYGGDGDARLVNVKIQSKNLPATMETIAAKWKKVDPVHPLEARFYDDLIEEAYQEFSVMIKIIGFLAFLAISIASLGLLGMVVFLTETRIREISIRKVLGATEGNLIYLLSRGFLLLLLIAAGIALPVTYIFFEQVVLPNFAYHEAIAISDLIIGAGAVMLVALVMIGSQTLKVAHSNPAQVLKSE
ncbi:MAG: ABC transporter permease, partial [Bacteroidota bacterium]